MRIAIPMAGAALLALLAEPAAAQRAGIHAEGGVSHLHGTRAVGAGAHVFRSVGRTEATRFDFGAIGDAHSWAIDAGLDYREMRLSHPLLGDNNVLQLLRMMRLHEERHQEQIRDILHSPAFPKAA